MVFAHKNYSLALFICPFANQRQDKQNVFELTQTTIPVVISTWLLSS